MTDEALPQGMVDQVQIFSMAQAGHQISSDLATSPNSNIAVLRIPARQDTQLDAQESDRILVVLRGEGIVAGPEGERALATQQGMLIPPGVECRLTNSGREELVLFSMQTKRAAALVANVPSDVQVKVPIEFLNAKGIGSRIYAYIMDRCTIGLSPLIMEEWNQVSAVRMNCRYEKDGDIVVATLPERAVRWYGIDSLSDSDYALRTDRTRTRVRVDLTPYIERKARA